jgi:hypothetical protein
MCAQFGLELVLQPAPGGQAAAMPPAKRSLLEASFGGPSSPKPPSGKKRPLTVAAQVQRAILDNFKGFTEQEIDSTIYEGLSLRARLYKDKATNQQAPGTIVMGRAYYNQLRSSYQSLAHPAKQLQVKDPQAEVRQELFQAMLASKKVPAQRQPMLQLLQNMTKVPNQSEMVGILRWMVELRPTASSEQYQGVIQTMKWITRLGLDNTYPEEIKVCQAAFEQGLMQAMVRYCSI